MVFAMARGSTRPLQRGPLGAGIYVESPMPAADGSIEVRLVQLVDQREDVDRLVEAIADLGDKTCRRGAESSCDAHATPMGELC